MDKFSLKWNNFEANASKFFRNLRKEEHFYDVTLVSDDEQIVSAHKLVLSASSHFFKNILKKTTHSNPLVYLPGVKSADLNFIIDYIYYGEVQFEQDNLDNFLNVAQKLKIEGLTEGQKKEKYLQEEYSKDEIETAFYTTETESSESNILVENDCSEYRRTRYDEYEKSVSLVNQNYSKKELTKIVDELVLKDGSMSVCKSCGKTSSRSSDMRKHVEIHIEGLSFPCPICNNTFRSINILKCHTQRFHETL